MTETANHFKLGLFVIAGFAALITVAGWLVTSGFREETFTAYAFFDEPVTGLEVGSPVRYRGMAIGSISGIRSAEDKRYIRVRSEIEVQKLIDLGLREAMSLDEPEPEIPRELRARIERNVITGIAFIQTDFYPDPDGQPPSYPFQVPENTVPSVPSATKTFEQALEESLTKLPTLIEKLDDFVAVARTKLDDLDVAGVSADARSALRRLDRIFADIQDSRIDETFLALVEEMRAAVDSIDALLVDARADDGAVKTMVGAARRMAERIDAAVAAADLGGTTATIRDLGRAYADFARDAGPLLPELRGAIVALRRVAELLERDPSALVRGRATPADPRRR